MSLPTLRPPNVPQQYPIHLPTPPPTSSPYRPLHDGPPGQWPPIPATTRDLDNVLLAQEAAEDSRLQARASQMWRESQEYSCAEDNETTPWLQHTRWPERFRNRPLDIITASSRLPAWGRFKQGKELVLGNWQGIPLYSSAAAEARVHVIMRAVDDMFDRAEDTLACTPYQSRCWLTSYRNGVFRNRPLRVMPPSTGRRYKSKWKRFICYIFRALDMGVGCLREVHNMPLRGDDIKMMNHIADLASQIVERGDIDDTSCEKNDESSTKDGSDGDSDSDSDSGSGTESDSDGESNCPNDDYDGYSDCGSNGDKSRVDDRRNIDFKRGNGEGKLCNDGEDIKDDYAAYNSSSRSAFRLPHGIRLELSEALFQLSMMFWTYQSRDGVMDSSTIVHFTAVMGVHGSSLAYRDAYYFTPDLAALIWVGRLLFLEYSLPKYGYNTLVYPWPARDMYASQPERLEAIRKKYMLRGCYSPLSELLELKAFGKSIVRREGRRGTLTWAPDGHSFTIGDGQVIHLSEFCTTYRAAITRVQELVAEMMLGWDPAVNLSTISDDLTCQLPGWCFLDKPDNQLCGGYKAMSRRAWSASFRGKALAKAGHWLPGPCLAYLQAGAELSMKSFPAIHITAGLPGRGTEITSIRFRNTKLAIRNLFVREGRVIIVISYTKARSSNNHAFYIVRYLPDDLGLSIVFYLGYIRPFLDFLASQLGLPHYHSNEFLFPDPKCKKRHISTMQATESLRNLTQALQTPWTISLYRQASIAIAKRHISELIKERNFYYPNDANSPIRIIAAGVGHRPRMLLTAYAIDRALPVNLVIP